MGSDRSDSAANLPANPIGPGTIVDQFKVLREIGRGGMGQVFLARDQRLGRKVAIKVIHPKRLGASDSGERFLFEARTTAQLNHPHIVTVYAAGEVAEGPYVVMEYLEGQSLRERLREERPALRESLRIILCVAEALDEAHRHGVLHRDLKPGNVLIPRDGRPRVVDFGLAKRIQTDDSPTAPQSPSAGLDADASGVPGPNPDADASAAAPNEVTAEESALLDLRSHTEGICGTPAYMAPEQWQQLPCTPATDVWALGVMLCELVYGRRPYLDQEGSVLSLAFRVVDTQPVPELKATDDVPEPVAVLCRQCMEKDPELRPSTEDVASRLQKILSEERRHLSRHESPFPGLLPFSERHAPFFFGREAEVDAFLERMREQGVLPVVGPSGAGKSSFVRAGVLPRVREMASWVVVDIRPRAEPFQALAAALKMHRSGSITLSDLVAETADLWAQPQAQPSEEASAQAWPRRAADLADMLRESPPLLGLLLGQVAEQENVRVLLLVDQLEELYTLVDSVKTRRRFMEALCLAADDAQDPVRVIFTLRDDFLGRLAEGPVVREALGRVTVVRTPSVEILSEILTQPLAAVGYRYDDPSLVTEMVDAVQGEPACLPVLQFTCRMLWDRRDKRGRVLRRGAYDALGGVVGALAEHADGVLKGLSTTQLHLARQILLQLVTPQSTRRVVPQSQLVALGDEAGQVLERLVAGRLVLARRSRKGAEQAELELVHESLIGAWHRLARWIEESREERVFLAELTQGAELWQKRGRRDEEVWQGDALHDARRSLQRFAAQAPPVVEAFLRAGMRRVQRRVRHKRWAVAGSFAVVLVVAAVLGIQTREARRQRNRAETEQRQGRIEWAEAQREAARAALLRGDHLEARAKLRTSLEVRDSALTRALWWRLQREPLHWQKRMSTVIYDLAFSPDGRTVAVAAQDGALYLFDVRTRTVRILRGLKDQSFSIAISPDGRWLAAGTWRGAVGLWDLRTGEVAMLKGHQSAVMALVFSRDSRRLITGSEDDTLRVWDVSQQKTLRVLRGHKGPVRGMDVAADGKWLISGSVDKTLRRWNLDTGAMEQVFHGHSGPVRGVRIAPGGQAVYSASSDGDVRVWDLRTGTPLRTLRGHTGGVRQLAFHPSGRLLASASDDGTVRLWDLPSGELRHTLRHKSMVRSAAFSPNGRLLASGGLDETLRLWSLDRLPAREPPKSHSSQSSAVDFSPRGRMIASGGNDGTVRLWDVHTGRVRRVLRGHKAFVVAVTFGPRGSLLASAGVDRTIRLWLSLSGALLRRLTGHTGTVLDLEISPDGRTLASASEDRTIRLWDVATGQLRRVLKGHEGAVSAVAFDPRGARLASAGWDRTVRLWDVASGRGRVLAKGHRSAVGGIAFSPDGQHLASASDDQTVRLWGVESGTSKQVAAFAGRAYWLSFSPDGQWLGVPLSSKNACLVHVRRGTQVVLQGHRAEVNRVRFSPDGRTVVTSSDDGTVRLWSAPEGHPIWRGPVLWGQPMALYSHRGWTPLVPGTSATPSRRTRWQRFVEKEAAQGDVDVMGRLLCARTVGQELVIWELAGDRALVRLRLGKLREVRAHPHGCVAVTQKGTLHWVRSSGEAQELAHGVDAVAVDRGEILAALNRQVHRWNARGVLMSVVAGNTGVTALGRAGDKIVLGYAQGHLELVSSAPGRRRTIGFEETPAAAVVRMVRGPSDTLIVGFANGLLGIWSLSNGNRLYHTQLHGPVIHLRLEGSRVFAATELGDHQVVDLRVFYQRPCELLREVWATVPVVWEAGLPVLRSPPKSHRCR